MIYSETVHVYPISDQPFDILLLYKLNFGITDKFELPGVVP